MANDFSDYEKALSYTHSLLRFGSRPGLGRVSDLLRFLGNPQDELKFIHVAGTNGKGSTCRMIASAARCEGLKTGLYTSPYVTEFLERIMINDAPVKKSIFAKTALYVKDVIEKKALDITEFEFITAVAFCIFKEEKCDIVVLETGMGGRFDATNVIKRPIVSVITSISLDHTKILGDTVEKIAFEKAGIIKPGNPCVTDFYNLPQVKQVIKKACLERKSGYYETENPFVTESALFGSRFEIGGEEYETSLVGEHQTRNASLAVSACQIADFSQSSIKQGLKCCKNPARFEIISKNPLVILDGGHNVGCAEAIAKTLGENLGGRKITAITGMMADKDIDGFLKILAPMCERIITVKPSNPRSLGAGELKKLAEKYCGNIIAAKGTDEALTLGKNADVLLICGSLYLAGDIRRKAINRFNNV